jgi:hypothetical protein
MTAAMFARPLAAWLLVVSTVASAQLVATNPDWKEADAPAPPVVRKDGLIPIELIGSELRWGVDPASISVGPDGIVRYVVVATSASGAVNAFYEGLRCTHSEVKVYARYTADGPWTQARNAEWRPLNGNGSRHSNEIAKAGACQGHAPNGPASRIVRELGGTPTWWGSR